MVEYYIQWRSAAGVRRSILTGAGPGDGGLGRNYFLRFAYRKALNAAGKFRIDLPADLPDLAQYADKDQVEIWRRDQAIGLDWDIDFHGVFRDEALVDDNLGVETFQAIGHSALGRLGWYHVLWPAGRANRTTFSGAKAETILKTLVTYNATTSATIANGRDRNAPNYGITVASDAAGGNTLTVSTGERKNLLDTLRAIQPIAGGDFDLIKTAANTWEFRFYPGQRGTDRRGSLLFSKALGNMANVRYELVRSSERTVAIIGGQGDGEARAVATATGPNYASGNDIETFINATDIRTSTDTTAQLQARGQARLNDMAARKVFAFSVLQTDNCRYGRDFNVGDLARAFHPRIGTIDVQITAVEVEYSPGEGETLEVEVALR
jgi:hypothetical protein